MQLAKMCQNKFYQIFLMIDISCVKGHLAAMPNKNMAEIIAYL